jgi:hypothetical protein
MHSLKRSQKSASFWRVFWDASTKIGGCETETNRFKLISVAAVAAAAVGYSVRRMSHELQ